MPGMNPTPSLTEAPTADDFFHHCPRCATPRAEPATTPFHCAACGFRYYFNVASAVAVFIENPVGECLFIRRARPPAEGKLALPGGFVDPAETSEDAARREIWEELRIKLATLHYLGSWPNRYYAGGFVVPVLDLFFRARVGDITHTPDPAEVSAATWLPPASVNPAELAFPSMRAALAAYLQARR